MLNKIMAKRKHPSQAPRRSASGGAQWLYGMHAVLAALANPRRRFRRLLVTAEAKRNLAEIPPLPAEVCLRQDLEGQLPAGAVHQGIALLAEPLQAPPLHEICGVQGDSVVVVLDRADDPRNVGAVLRSAAAFGAGAVIVPTRHAPDATPVLAKAASGALETVPLLRVTNIARALAELKEAGFWCAGLDAAGETTLAGAELSGRIALVLGSEGDGLRRLTRETCDLLVRIPQHPGVDSLNLSAAAAVALYELARGR